MVSTITLTTGIARGIAARNARERDEYLANGGLICHKCNGLIQWADGSPGPHYGIQDTSKPYAHGCGCMSSSGGTRCNNVRETQRKNWELRLSRAVKDQGETIKNWQGKIITESAGDKSRRIVFAVKDEASAREMILKLS